MKPFHLLAVMALILTVGCNAVGQTSVHNETSAPSKKSEVALVTEGSRGLGAAIAIAEIFCCYRSRCFQLAYNPDDGSWWHELIGWIIWRLNQWQF